jgi:hypothetical protein
MLSYPDRRKFEQLRARWEAADKGGNGATDMGGRKEKQAILEPGPGEPFQYASKFRRKLSNSLAFISNPLSQRKSLSGRQLASNPSLAAIVPNTDNAELSPLQDPTSEIPSLSHSQAAPETQDSLHQSQDLDQTPKPLPKSRTISYIPRPSRSVSGASTENNESVIRVRSPTLAELKGRTSSKIPCPSPSLSTRRVSSPRQHISSQRPKDITAVKAFAVSTTGSPSKRSVRSHTTPNLVEAISSAQTEDPPVPRMSGIAKYRAASDRNSMLQKDLPTTKRASLHHSQVQDIVLKRESLSGPTTVLNRRSLEPRTLMVQNKQQVVPSTTIASRHPSSRAQASVTNENNRPSDLTDAKPSQILYSNKVSTPVVSPPVESSTVQSSIEINTQKKSWKTRKVSHIPTDANHQVRKLSNSSTFHHFTRNWETIPSLLQVSKQIGSTSASDLTVALTAKSEITVAKTSLTISNYPVCNRSPKRCQDHRKNPTAKKTDNIYHQAKLVELKDGSPNSPLLTTADSHSDTTSGKLISMDTLDTLDTLVKQDRSISDHSFSSYADTHSHAQIKRQMPPPWWAGRFQSRFDQWRTAVMAREFNPSQSHKYQIMSPLYRYSLDEEKLAAAHILRQLRDLCTTNEAADSLWVCLSPLYSHTLDRR